jgi:hypothetical protein
MPCVYAHITHRAVQPCQLAQRPLPLMRSNGWWDCRALGGALHDVVTSPTPVTGWNPDGGVGAMQQPGLTQHTCCSATDIGSSMYIPIRPHGVRAVQMQQAPSSQLELQRMLKCIKHHPASRSPGLQQRPCLGWLHLTSKQATKCTQPQPNLAPGQQGVIRRGLPRVTRGAPDTPYTPHTRGQC